MVLSHSNLECCLRLTFPRESICDRWMIQFQFRTNKNKIYAIDHFHRIQAEIVHFDSIRKRQCNAPNILWTQFMGYIWQMMGYFRCSKRWQPITLPHIDRHMEHMRANSFCTWHLCYVLRTYAFAQSFKTHTYFDRRCRHETYVVRATSIGWCISIECDMHLLDGFDRPDGKFNALDFVLLGKNMLVGDVIHLPLLGLVFVFVHYCKIFQLRER